MADSNVTIGELVTRLDPDLADYRRREADEEEARREAEESAAERELEKADPDDLYWMWLVP